MNVLQDILKVLRRGEAGPLNPLTKGNQPGFSVPSTVVKLRVPARAVYGEAYVRTSAVVYTRDSSEPTSSEGFPANAGDIIILRSRAELLGFKAIRESTDATLDVYYFERVAERQIA